MKKKLVESEVNKLKKKVIIITEEQLSKFAANILEIQGRQGKIVALSTTAHDALTSQEKETLGLYAKLVPIKAPNIEIIGGGSVRCMIAELF